MNTIYKLYNMRFTKCTKDEYIAIGEGNYSKNTQYIVENPNGQMELYLGDKSLVSENNYTDSDKQKVDFLPNSATQNDFNKAFQANWNETNTNSLAYIRNKPAFSDKGIYISGPIQSSRNNVTFNASDYSTNDLTEIDKYMFSGIDPSKPEAKYDFYLDGVIQPNDKDILKKLIDGTWKQVRTNVVSNIRCNGAYKQNIQTQVRYVPTNIYTYDEATNSWIQKPNINNTEFVLFQYMYYLQDRILRQSCNKYVYAHEYNIADINRIQNIIDKIGDNPTLDDYLKYDLNMDGIIDEIDKSLVEKLIPSITGINDYWEKAYITRTIGFGFRSAYNQIYYMKSLDSGILSTEVIVWYAKQGETSYKVFSGQVGERNRQILDIRNLNIQNVNALEAIKSPKGQITNIEATSVSAKSVNVTDVSATSVDSSKLVLPNKSNTKQIINKIDSTANDINKLTASDNNSIPTSFAIKDFVSKSSVVQVNSDWNETDENSKAFIKNKPDLDAYVKQDQLTPVSTDLFALKDKINSSLDFTLYPIGSEENFIPLKIGDEINLFMDSFKMRTVLVSGSIGPTRPFTAIGIIGDLYDTINGGSYGTAIRGNVVYTDVGFNKSDATIIPPSKFNNIIFEICLNTVGRVTGIFSKEFKNGVATNDGLGLSIYKITGLIAE